MHATDGLCTHGNTHLADGLVDGTLIECPKHNGRFDVTTGAARRLPACVALRRHDVRDDGHRLWLRLPAIAAREEPFRFIVVSNHNVTTFIKELVLEGAPDSPRCDYRPGQYLQLRIPAYDSIHFRDIAVDEPYAATWRAHQLFDLTVSNPLATRRNYSIATDPAAGGPLHFNVRIATPPHGQACDAGAGSSYVWALRPGDTVEASGPYGEFLIRDSAREMVYLGGGAGMAPMRAHIAHLFETLQTGRQVSFWYGARSRQEVYYEAFFRQLESRHSNFRFHLALSAPLPGDDWHGPVGFIHDLLRREHLDAHPDPTAVEYYLCGPPPMVHAAREMLRDGLGVAPDDIAYDEY